eukprot:15336707-Ditylum_brightwellii.AAC.1
MEDNHQEKYDGGWSVSNKGSTKQREECTWNSPQKCGTCQRNTKTIMKKIYLLTTLTFHGLTCLLARQPLLKRGFPLLRYGSIMG